MTRIEIVQQTLTAPYLLGEGRLFEGCPRLSQRCHRFVCVVVCAGRGGGRTTIRSFRHRPYHTETRSIAIDKLPSPSPTNSPFPHLPGWERGRG
jgi:hypothetical protein